MSWLNLTKAFAEEALRMTAEEMDREMLNKITVSNIDEPLRFKLALKGLVFGGVLHDWSLKDALTSRPLSHRHPIVPGKVTVHTRHTTTGVVYNHYPDDYVVTTEAEYYYLGERNLAHDKFTLRQSKDRFGATIYTLIDLGYDGENVMSVASTHISVLDLTLSNKDITYEIRCNLIAAYKRELRRGR